MRNEERRAYDNLLLLCPNCHSLIDDLDPDGHPVDYLQEIKARHEEAAREKIEWASEADLDRYAKELLLVQFAFPSDPRDTEPEPPATKPLTAGSTPTTITEPTPPSEANHP